MQRIRSLHLSLILCSVATAGVLTAAEAGAADFQPSAEQPVGWRGTGNSVYPGADPPTEFGPESNIAWRVDLENWSWSTPVVIGDLVVTQAEPHTVVGVDLADGSIRWQYHCDQFELMEAAKAKEGRALVAEEDAAVQAARDWGEQVEQLLGELNKAGHKDWSRKKASKAFGDRHEDVGTPPDAALAKRWQELVATGKQQGYQYDRGTGTLQWTEAVSQRRSRLAAEFGVHWESVERGWNRVTGEGMATPVSDGEQIYVAMANNVVACLDLAGKPVWQQFDPKARQEKDPQNRARRQLHFVASPVLADDLVIVAQDANRLRAYRQSDGSKVWESDYPIGKNTCGTPSVIDLGGQTALVAANGRVYKAADGSVLIDDLPVLDGGCSPLVAGDVVYLTSGDKKATHKGLTAFRLSADGAELLWNRPDAGQSDRAPVLAHGLLFTGIKQGKKDLYIGCLDPASGETVATSEVKAKGNPVYNVAGDKLIVKDNAEEFWIFSADKELKKLGNHKLEKAKGFAYPTFAGDKMIIRLGNELIAIGG